MLFLKRIAALLALLLAALFILAPTASADGDTFKGRRVNIDNLVYNPDFEIVAGGNQPDGWTMGWCCSGPDPAWGLTTDAYTGSRALYVQTHPGVQVAAAQSRPFPLSHGQVLFASYASRTPTGGPRSTCPRLFVRNSTGSIIETKDFCFTPSGTNWGFEQLPYSYTVPANAATGVVWLRIESEGVSSLAHIDAFALGPRLQAPSVK